MENRLQAQADKIFRIIKEKGMYSICFGCLEIPLPQDREAINNWLVSQGNITIVKTGLNGSYNYIYKQL